LVSNSPTPELGGVACGLGSLLALGAGKFDAAGCTRTAGTSGSGGGVAVSDARTGKVAAAGRSATTPLEVVTGAGVEAVGALTAAVTLVVEAGIATLGGGGGALRRAVGKLPVARTRTMSVKTPSATRSPAMSAKTTRGTMGRGTAAVARARRWASTCSMAASTLVRSSLIVAGRVRLSTTTLGSSPGVVCAARTRCSA
jgi:hypothetical protein